MRSSSSVEIPGATLRPTSSRACAAMRPATRTFSMISWLLISLPLNGRGAGLSTYSGLSIPAGTGRRGDSVPGTTGRVSETAEFSDMAQVYEKEVVNMAAAKDKWWYNLSTGKVEKGHLSGWL